MGFGNLGFGGCCCLYDVAWSNDFASALDMNESTGSGGGDGDWYVSGGKAKYRGHGVFSGVDRYAFRQGCFRSHNTQITLTSDIWVHPGTTNSSGGLWFLRTGSPGSNLVFYAFEQFSPSINDYKYILNNAAAVSTGITPVDGDTMTISLTKTASDSTTITWDWDLLVNASSIASGSGLVWTITPAGLTQFNYGLFSQNGRAVDPAVEADNIDFDIT